LPLPTPHPGLVISYSYLWHDERRRGREDGKKDRPCAIVLINQALETTTVVTVVPITHTRPDNAATALEIPPTVKALLGLDDDPQWIIATEVNNFVWPGPDLRTVPGSSARFDYGVLPPTFFRQLRDLLVANRNAGAVRVVARTS
jgi:hypothetical protein